MTGLDTNVLVRYIAQDDPLQSPVATRLIEALTAEEPGFVSLVTLVELGWVLASCYEFSREELAGVFHLLTRTKVLFVDRSETVVRAIRMFESGSADFADCLIEGIGSDAGCEKTVTFDSAAAKTAGMTLLRAKG